MQGNSVMPFVPHSCLEDAWTSFMDQGRSEPWSCTTLHFPGSCPSLVKTVACMSSLVLKPVVHISGLLHKWMLFWTHPSLLYTFKSRNVSEWVPYSWLTHKREHYIEDSMGCMYSLDESVVRTEQSLGWTYSCQWSLVQQLTRICAGNLNG